MIRRILFSLAALALAGALAFTLVVHLWNRYQAETVAMGFSGIYERYLAFQTGFLDEMKAFRALADTPRTPSAAGREAAAVEE
jgi:hypothetical protein